MYYYLIFVHMGGRVIDIYHRLSGNVNHFFLPHDDEISLNYLKWVCAKALRFNHRVSNAEDTVVDERGKRVPVHFVHVYKFDKETHELYSYRSFIRDYDGAIREIHIQKKYISDEGKRGLVVDLPPRPGRHRFNRDEFFRIPKEEESKEEEKKSGLDDEEDPEKSLLKNSGMDSRMNLRDELGSGRRSRDQSQSDNSQYDRRIDEEEDDNHDDDDEEEAKHLKRRR